ncbi:La-Related Protein 1 [Manis pentadactyla]|nr:La-Related Protein 1 [Manis pentadactyla]
MRNVGTRNMVELKCHHPEDGPSGTQVALHMRIYTGTGNKNDQQLVQTEIELEIETDEEMEMEMTEVGMSNGGEDRNGDEDTKAQFPRPIRNKRRKRRRGEDEGEEEEELGEEGEKEIGIADKLLEGIQPKETLWLRNVLAIVLRAIRKVSKSLTFP